MALPKTAIWPLGPIYLGQVWPRLLRGSAEGLAAKETQKAVLHGSDVSSLALLFRSGVLGCSPQMAEVSLTLYCVARLPLELGRVATELVVRTKDERNVSCLLVNVRPQSTQESPLRACRTKCTNNYACRQASIEA